MGLLFKIGFNVCILSLTCSEKKECNKSLWQQSLFKKTYSSDTVPLCNSSFYMMNKIIKLLTLSIQVKIIELTYRTFQVHYGTTLLTLNWPKPDIFALLYLSPVCIVLCVPTLYTCYPPGQSLCTVSSTTRRCDTSWKLGNVLRKISAR